MASKTLRIAVLECDTPLPRALDRYKRYGAITKSFLLASASPSPSSSQSQENGNGNVDKDEKRAELDISIWDVVNKGEFPNLEDDREEALDGVVITGSKWNAWDPSEPWILNLVSFTQKLLHLQSSQKPQTQTQCKIIGICFGHQIVARAMGADVGRNDRNLHNEDEEKEEEEEKSSPWEVSVCAVQLSECGRKFFFGNSSSSSSSKRVGETLSIFQMHRDIVYDYPPHVQPLGSSPRCEVQGMYVPGRVITVQGHPEFNEEIVREILEVRHAQGIFGDAEYEEAMGRVGRKHDGLVVGRRMLEFLREQ